jgi:hypothetical protein
MSKISRADWAATTPWDGITNKPASFGVSDIGGLTAIGYSDGQIPVYSHAAGRFRPGSRLAPSPTPTPTPAPTESEVALTWDVPNLHALQTATEDFYIPGVFVSHPVVIGAPFDDQNVQFSGSVVDLNMVRISVTNLGLADVDLATGIWRVRFWTA